MSKIRFREKNKAKKLPSRINHSASFRDPSGSIFTHDNEIYRRVNKIYKPQYEYLLSSGLYKRLVKDGLLIPHEEVNLEKIKVYKIIKPIKIPFISYPYEWCFSQLKDAAILTLKIQKIALEFGMTLKDASAFNVQFLNGKTILIDSLSFEKYKPGAPWVAYRQFCQHFLAPLSLIVYKDVRLNQLSRIYIDGIPLDLVVSILPWRVLLKSNLFIHLYLHAKSQKAFADKFLNPKKHKVSLNSLRGLIESLEKTIKDLTLKTKGSTWSNYQDTWNYSKIAYEDKKRIIKKYLIKAKPKGVWDLGANMGDFSRIASSLGAYVISIDNDALVIERNYLSSKKKGEEKILPLVIDLTNPSPKIGWENKERESFLERGSTDCLLALALIHHLAISNNLSFEMIASSFSKLCRFLLIEFVPKDDSQVKKLLRTREDIYGYYSKDNFEKVFAKYFEKLDQSKLKKTNRVIYFYKRKGR